ncbi:MAG TPA: hypothetical protein VFG86_10200 [Chloroflexota bacterium]|nr:hypothetical protein [Chloroflexota bacterium]
MADLADALLAADEAGRAELLRSSNPAELQGAVAALGHRHEQAAAEVLAIVDSVVEDRTLRKAARRELHRLRSAGIQPPQTAPAPGVPSTPAPASEPSVPITQAWATDFDPTGARALWLLGDRPLGGAWFGALLFDELKGLLDVSLVDTTRKRFMRELEQRRLERGEWVQLPGEYALRLVREAVDINRATDTPLPTRYRALRDAFGEAPGPPERALVYETISPVEASFHPDWLSQTGDLMDEPELHGWYIPVPEAMRTRALDVARAPTAALLVPGQEPDQQALQLFEDAERQALSPALRRALQRRLEETAYFFVTSDRLTAARHAVASARALENRNLPLAEQPLLRIMLEGGLARLVRSESVGGRAAADVLIELLERSFDQSRERGRPGVESRPSGLILPR